MSGKVEEMETQKLPVLLPISESNLPSMTIEKADVFVDLIDEIKPRYVFWRLGKDLTGTAGILVDGVLLNSKIIGYHSLTELLEGYRLGFGDGTIYRTALDLGAENFDEYQRFLTSGFGQLNDFREILNTEVPGIYDIWCQSQSKLLPSSQVPRIKNLLEFYQKLSNELDFVNLETDEIIEALTSGFLKGQDYLQARENGFLDAKTYFHAKQFGINDGEKYLELSGLGIEYESNWKLYQQAKIRAEEEGFSDILGKVLHEMLGSERSKSEWSISTIQGIISINLVGKYGIKAGEYFQLIMNKSDEVIHRIANHPDVQQLIFIYHSYFYRRTLKTEETLTATVDLCNVVLEGYDGPDDNKKGEIGNFISIVDKLRALGVEEVNVFADATVHHYLSKPEIKLVKEISDNFWVAEKGFSADMMMISYAQKYPSFMVTNDHLEGYRSEKNPWTIENIPRLLAPYFFDDQGKVSLGLKEAELLQPIRQ